jgi:hypothetical protein
MTPAEILAIRKELGMSRGELGAKLGLSDGKRKLGDLELGARGDKVMVPSGPMVAALRFLVTLHRVRRALHRGERVEAANMLNEVLSTEKCDG